MLRNVILKEILGVRSTVWMVAIALLVALIVVGLLASGAYAAPTTFTVNSTADPGTGGCDATECTLREAINAANANNNPTEKDRINFNISGTGVHTISPTSPLPQITEPVIINGYSQPGSSANTLAKGTNAVLTIELDGTEAGTGLDANGVGIGAKGTVVKGLVINSFAVSGIRLLGGADANGTKIQGNFIGTNPAGTTAQGNNSDGIALTGNSNVVVGGTLASMRNLISGSALAGVVLFNFEAGTNNKVLGNLIGTDKNGSGNLGNGNSGVAIFARQPNNATTVQNNTIAFNGNTTEPPARATDGVVLFGDVGSTDTIRSNSIFANKGLGIDLIDFPAGERGDTDISNANDSCDTDEGTNDLQNKPNLTSALTSSGTTTIKGSLNSKPNQTFTVEFFRNPPGTDEGKTFLGQKSVSTNSNCTTGTFTFIPNQAVSAGQNITATATDSEGNTSEFSAPETVG
jgi:CSLREA domain-containing protein